MAETFLFFKITVGDYQTFLLIFSYYVNFSKMWENKNTFSYIITLVRHYVNADLISAKVALNNNSASVNQVKYLLTNTQLCLTNIMHHFF